MPGDPSEAARRWLEADRRLRSEYLHHLLGRDEVRVFFETYVGDTDPDEVARRTEAAGLGLDAIDVGLLSNALVVKEGLAPPDVVGLSDRSRRWLEGQ